MNATKTKYTIGIYNYGLREWKRESNYDFYSTNHPLIVAVAKNEDDAQEWIDKEMAKQEREIDILPGHGFHRLYTTISLDEPEAYMTRQDAARNPCDIGKRKYFVLSDPKVKKL